MLLDGVWLSDVAGRTWIASPDGSSGDGLLADILDQAAEADSVRLLGGLHTWEDLASVSLAVEGEKGAIVSGLFVGARDPPVSG